MKKYKLSIILTFSMAMGIGSAEAQSQIYGNLVSVDAGGITDTADYAPIFINSDGNVVVAGNEMINASQYNATTQARAANGVAVWQQSISTGNKAFTTASTHDAAGFIYVVGTVRTSTVNGLDYFVSKSTPSGSQVWIKYYNNGGSDVASAVAVDASGNVYVTGASDGGLALIDYATIKYNSAGTQQWVSRYNYSNMIDVPTGITINSSGSQIMVAGSSGTSYTSWDYATVKYNPSGSQISVNRTPSTGGQDKVFSMVTDASGNVYVTGSTGGANPNVQTMKLDTALNTVWLQPLDVHGYNDAGIGIALDNSNNVIVTGFGYRSNGTRDLFVVKYNNGGTEQWRKIMQPTDNASDAEGLRVKTNSSNDIFVGGNCTENNNQDIWFLRFNSAGQQTFERRYNGTSNSTDKFLDFTLDANYIYISAKTFSTTTVDQNITIKYEYKLINQGSTTNANGLKYEPKELIVEFNKKALKMSAINNKNLHFGKLNDFVADSTCSKITTKLDPDGHLRIDAKNFEARKMFTWLNENDSLSLSRTGNYVKVPKYYAYLILTMPSGVSNVSASNSLYTIKPDIYSCELNVILDLAGTAKTASANDPQYNSDQGNLHGITNYPNSNVNCDTAWSISGGEPNIKVGVYDTGIDFTHPDFGNITQNGWDFTTNTQGLNNDDSDHGTSVSSVISAVRNNNVGIAGIAGRDASTANQGVSLYDCKVCAYSTCYITNVTPGIVKGLQGTNIGGFGLNVMNLSINLAYNYYNYFPFSWGGSCIKAMNDANRNAVTMAAAKGNAQSGTVSIASCIFPGDYSDETTMAVGSTGRDGHHCLWNINCSNASTVWGNIDFSAPGTDSLVKTFNNLQGYKWEDGTSHASPHVAGAAALMESYRNTTPNWDNMVHEDCEHILQRTATDLSLAAVYNETPGYDSITGWGRINITRAMREINKNYYRFRHITESVGSTSSNRALATLSTNVGMYWNNFNAIAPGTYSTDVFELTTTLNYVLQPGEVIIDTWPFYKECYGVKLDDDTCVTDRPYYSKIVSVTNTQAVLKTYFYRHNPTLTNMPYPTNLDIKSAIVLYTYDGTGSVGLHDGLGLENYKNFVVFPNPSTGMFDIKFNSDYNSRLTYKVFNVLGQQVVEGGYTPNYGPNTFKLNMEDYTNGVYILNIFDKDKIVHKQKIIKN